MGKFTRKVFRLIRSKILYNNSEKSLRTIMGMIKDNGTTGDYLEFGVYKGGSMNHAMQMAEEMKIQDMTFYGFDSFDGMPKHNEGGTIKEGDYSCSEEEVEVFLIKQRYDYNFYLIKGWFKDIAPLKMIIKDVAVVNIDCDFYESTKDVLRLIKPFLKTGMIIRFDDWFLFLDGGQKKAFEEFKETVKDFEFQELNDGSGKVFIVNGRIRKEN